jgi:hypothetical protein
MAADVRSIDALREWYAALTGYGEMLAESVAGVELEIRRGFEWLQEQLGRWQKAVRECEEDVVQAKAELAARKYPGFDGREPDTTVQERNLRRAKARLEYAEDQVARTKAWIGRLPKVIDEVYRGPSHRLVNFLEAELPKGLAILDRRIIALENYANLRTEFGEPARVSGRSSSASSDSTIQKNQGADAPRSPEPQS